MEYTRLSLVLTDRCNAACDYCSQSCGPDGGKVMDKALMLRVIREAKSLGAQMVEFTGGEPFLYPELLIEGARAAHEEKLRVEVTTNGFWGCWDEEKILKTLKDLHPDHVNVSTDFFHSKFIPVEHAAKACGACAHLGVSYLLLVADMDGSYSAGRYLQSTGSHFFSVDTRIYPLRRCGRALSLPVEWFLPTDRTDDMLSIFYDGDVYSSGPNEGREPTMKLGNALQTPLREMLGDSVCHFNAGKEAKSDVQ